MVLEENKNDGFKKEDAERYARDILGLAAHDTNSAFTKIIGLMNRMLEGKSGVMDAEAQQRLTYIAKQISELKESLDDYFVASIPGKDCLKETVDLYQNIIAPLCNQEYFKEALKAKNITHYFWPDKRIGGKVSVKVNKGLTKSIYHNLLSNAIKHTPIDGLIIFDFSDDGVTYEFSVFNSGRPVASDKQESIFDLFESEGGLGFGLAAIRKLVRKHGGDLRCEDSMDGKHPIFVLTLPKE
ncbi:MAG: HAMP domain-containing sensor histidine kinase [Parcubacteria group bacterium]|jgi:signal transduction histidine kinase